MLNINHKVQWQVKDDRFPTYYPWFTSGMLNVIDSWKPELNNKKVLEWGGGWSSIFWAFYCKQVATIETDKKWIDDIDEYAQFVGMNNLHISHRHCNEGDQSQVEYYTSIPEGCNPDIVVIDSVLRHECLIKALTLPRPLIIIHDNWMQDGFVCPASEELMAPYEIHNFIQEDHTDNHGRKWATAYWELK